MLRLFCWTVILTGSASCFWAGTLVADRPHLGLAVLVLGWMQIECGIYILLCKKGPDVRP